MRVSSSTATSIIGTTGRIAALRAPTMGSHATSGRLAIFQSQLAPIGLFINHEIDEHYFLERVSITASLQSVRHFRN